jgi:hypothetical protein
MASAAVRRVEQDMLANLDASEQEDVPAFVELESGGPSPGAFQMVGHG